MTDPDQTLPGDPERTIAGDGPGASVPADPSLPARIGRYRPLRVLGRGGMGVVYEAEQDTPRRRVALKVIRPELATPDLRRRFAHESLFLGRLQHPGIAQVYEAGTAETDQGAVPFIAMELVDGVPLNDWIAREHPDRATRLELMVSLCDAVHHAHQRGLIHRDLKPANVLVDGRGQPRVLDFGVARPADADLEASLVTSHGELIGTIAYMSPEQLAGDPNDLDTRSDVYALGVILYEALAGASPLTLSGRPLEDALRAIREDDPVPLAHHDPSLAGDLSVIAAKAMAKHRDDRYASANGLAMDLQRHLDDQPISAQPPSTLYLLRKFTRRHRPLVLAAAGVATAIVLGLVGSTWQAVRATRAEQLAQSRLDQAQAVTVFLQDMLAAVRPDEAQGRDVTVAEVLDRASSEIDRGELDDQPVVEMALRATLGNTYTSLGRLDVAEQHLARGLALADSLVDPRDPERVRLVLDLARVRHSRGQPEAAERLLASVLPALADHDPTIIPALGLLADLRYYEGRWGAADSVHARAQVLAERQADTDSLELASVLMNRAFVQDQRKRWIEAEQLIARAEAIYRRSLGDRHPRMASVLLKRGDLQSSLGRHDEALAMHTDGLALARAIYPEEHPTQADLLWRIGTDNVRLERFDAAQAAFREALAIRQRTLGPVHRDVALTLQSLGMLATRLGRFEEAEQYARQTIAMREEVFGPGTPGVISAVQDLGHIARGRGAPAEAEAIFARTDSLIAALPEHTGSLAADNAFYRAMSLQDQGRHADADPHFRRAVAFSREQYGDTHELVARALGNLATCLFRQGRKSEAADVQQQALAMSRELGTAGDALLMNIGNVAYLLDDAGRHAEADTLHREYIALAGELHGDSRRDQSSARGRYADNLMRRGRWAEAEEQARLLLAWRHQHLPADDPMHHTSAVYLVDALMGQGRLDEAAALLDQTHAALADLEASVDDRTRARLDRTRAALDKALAAR